MDGKKRERKDKIQLWWCQTLYSFFLILAFSPKCLGRMDPVVVILRLLLTWSTAPRFFSSYSPSPSARQPVRMKRNLPHSPDSVGFIFSSHVFCNSAFIIRNKKQMNWSKFTLPDWHDYHQSSTTRPEEYVDFFMQSQRLCGSVIAISRENQVFCLMNECATWDWANRFATDPRLIIIQAFNHCCQWPDFAVTFMTKRQSSISERSSSMNTET